MTPGPSLDLGVEGLSDATRVGQGRLGPVYRAKEGLLDRTVAVKVLDAGDLDERECRALAAVSGHPHIAALYAWGRTPEGRPYLVLDWLPGGTLADRLDEFGPMPWEEVAEIGVKLAGALAAAHGAGVLHGDVKPENVLVSSFDEPKLADFGLAARSHGATPAHAAPEVLSGKPATEASDVYSLASTLYALAAGRPAFPRPEDVLGQAPPDLRPHGVPGPLWEALAAALAKDAAARTSSARAFGEALRAAQRAAGLVPTRLVLPDPVAVPRGSVGADGRGRSLPAVAAPGAGVRGDRVRGIRPGMLALLFVTILALLTAASVALVRLDSDGDEDVDQVGASAPPTTAIVPTITATVPPVTEPATTTPRTSAPATTPTTRSGPAPSTTAATSPTTAPGSGIPACTPSFFRSTVTSDRPTYNNGDTVVVNARFENVSGRACSYTQTGTSSQLFNPFGDPMGPIRTLVGDNVDNVPFEPGTSQAFRAMWEVNTCVNPTTCYPGRYTITINVVPFGGGQASFEVT